MNVVGRAAALIALSCAWACGLRQPARGDLGLDPARLLLEPELLDRRPLRELVLRDRLARRRSRPPPRWALYQVVTADGDEDEDRDDDGEAEADVHVESSPARVAVGPGSRSTGLTRKVMG